MDKTVDRTISCQSGNKYGQANFGDVGLAHTSVVLLFHIGPLMTIWTAREKTQFPKRSAATGAASIASREQPVRLRGNKVGPTRLSE
jgi:hypothetical protein